MSTNTKKQTTNNTTITQPEEEKLTALSKYSPTELDSTPGIYKVNCVMAKTFNRFDPVNRFKFTLSFDLFENVPITFTSNPTRDSSGKVDYSKVFGGVEYALTLSSDPNCRRQRTDKDGSEICEIQGHMRIIHFINSVDNSDIYKLELMVGASVGEISAQTTKARFLTSRENKILHILRPDFVFTEAGVIKKPVEEAKAESTASAEDPTLPF